MFRRISIALALLVVLTLILSLPVLAFQVDHGVLRVHFIDVGQADSILVHLPAGETILIDAGNNDDANLVVDYLRQQGVTHLDHVIGTHPHEDHIGGLDMVIQSFDIGKVYLPKVSHNTQTYQDLLLAIKAKGLRVTQARAGLKLDVGPSIEAELLAPNSTTYEDTNNYSAVLKLTYGSTSFLFTGDAEAESEEELLKAGYDLNADVLKVGHHGSSSSTTPAFLKAVSSRCAVISVGKDNKYGHPHPETLANLHAAGVEIYRTDELGTIVATSDGHAIIFDKQSSPIKERAPSKASAVKIQSIGLQSEIVTIVNTGETSVDLAGWRLVSETGGQVFIFPSGTTIPAGGELKISSGRYALEGPNTIVWARKYIWNNDGDPGALYDADGKLVSRFEGR